MDTDNDGSADLNIDNDNDGVCDVNCDTDGDGDADTNLDTDNDGSADLNIDNDNDGVCDVNCDTDGDGDADTNLDTDNDGSADLNIDNDNDGVCDVNCDTDGDGDADTNLDTDNDGSADLNIDNDNDGVCDVNCDTDGDGDADTNLDTDNDGSADLNIDNDNDGVCDVNCDTDGDGICDTNCNDQIQLAAKVFLGGAYSTTDGLMTDSLRSQGLIPTTQPYSTTSYSYLGTENVSAGIFDTTGADAIVDWVLVELRDAANPAMVVETRAALVQRDGDIVDVDGTAALGFTSADGDYYVAIRHRNHLGCMSATTMSFAAGSPVMLDLTTSATTTYQLADTNGTEHGRASAANGAMTLWPGNYNHANSSGDKIILQGGNSDVDEIFIKVITDAGNTSFLPVYIVNGVYDTGDGNLDGKIILQGMDSDTDQIFISVTSHPTNSDNLPIFLIHEQIPK